MDYLIEFYKNLDSINLLLFWGVIIVITLLLIFSIIMIHKNRELKRLIIEKQIKKETVTSDIPIKQAVDNEVKETKTIVKEIKEPINITKETPSNQTEIPHIIEEKKFVAEEHIINYNEEITPQVPAENVFSSEPVKETMTPNRAYQRNVLKEMSSNQTSPIGIVKQYNNRELEYTRATDLNQALNIDNSQKQVINSQVIVPISQTTNNHSFNELAQKSSNNQDYLTEVSNKLSQAMPDIDRTEYEIRQEADAIISYEELMRKKDTIKTIDEEEAVISIGELYQKEKSKIYGITEEKKDQEFIDELKNFRNDL